MVARRFDVEYGKIAEYSPEKWYVTTSRGAGFGYPVEEYDTKKPAVKEARRLAKHPDNKPSVLSIQDKNGNVIEETRYD